MISKKYMAMYMALLFSINCYAAENEPRPISKPACAPYCEQINIISVVFVDEIKFLNASEKINLVSGIETILNSKKSKIKVVSRDSDRVDHFQRPTSSLIKIEVNFRGDDCNPSAIKMNVNIIAPNTFYTNEFICTSKDSFICIDEKFKKEIDVIVERYLFKATGGTIL